VRSVGGADDVIAVVDVEEDFGACENGAVRFDQRREAKNFRPVRNDSRLQPLLCRGLDPRLHGDLSFEVQTVRVVQGEPAEGSGKVSSEISGREAGEGGGDGSGEV